MSDNSIMSQEQIEEMLRMAGQVEAPAPAAVDLNTDTYLSRDEQDALGEMGNICMGTSATTMYTLLGKQVTITTPMLTCHTWETLAAEHPLPLVVVEVQYIEGISGNNLMLLKEYDVALITDLLMGGSGNIDPNNIVLDEISLSAIREVMNQMVGASSTSLASMLHKTVNISTPSSKRILIAQEKLSSGMDESDILLKIAFKMEIEGLLTSEIMQIMPIPFAQELANELLHPQMDDSPSAGAAVSSPTENIHTQTPTGYMPDAQAAEPAPPAQPQMQQPPAQQPPAQQPAYQQPPMQQQQPMQQPAYQQPPMQDPQQQMWQQQQQMWQQPPVQQGAPQQPPMWQQPPQGQPYPPYPYPPYPPYGYPQHGAMPGYPQHSDMLRQAGTVEVKDVEYPVFGGKPGADPGVDTQNLWRLLDVPMEVTVELGRCSKTIKQVLDLNVGSVVALDKLAGELVEIMVNGIQVARGEVVVIDESYGVRLTELNATEISEITKNG